MKRKKNLKKVNKGKLKNLLKRKKLLNNSGSATAELILIIAIMLVIVITVFYPQIVGILDTTFINIASWYNNALIRIGIF